MRWAPDWLKAVQEQGQGPVDAVLVVLHKLGATATVAMDLLHAMDDVPGPPGYENPNSPYEHAVNVLYAADRLYWDGPGDWSEEVDKALAAARQALGRRDGGIA